MLSETAVAVSGSGTSLSCASASRAEALRNLAQAGEQAKAAQVFAEAERVAQAIPYDSSRAEALSDLAQALAQRLKFSDALALLGARSLDEFVYFLAGWREPLAQFAPERPALFMEVLQTATRIFAWEQLGWGEVYAILTESAATS